MDGEQWSGTELESMHIDQEITALARRLQGLAMSEQRSASTVVGPACCKIPDCVGIGRSKVESGGWRRRGTWDGAETDAGKAADRTNAGQRRRNTSR
jgi:hypothetical protein